LYKRNDVVSNLIVCSRSTRFVSKFTNYLKLSSTRLVKEALNEVSVYDVFGLTDSLNGWVKGLSDRRRYTVE
jgi:hypothetical protein